ncbi:anti-sigma factor domain-containing protein [Bacillus sp. FJAT-18017]|uniref:anti-sigma factor domain-containing protein n=1 Tax=Bacillus sp. FJAT-18017 TaxID=1705566 RepID=UPI001E5A29BD|nr:anti-sigma factor domain-containing protein [Bacillus sp. FJAT-18017]
MDETFVTLLTPEGEFLKARKQKRIYSIGEEISFNPELLGLPEKKLSIKWLASMRRGITVAAAAVLLLASAMATNLDDNKVYAYMSIDVKPSIELGVNDKMEVIKLTAYNREGKEITSGLIDWEEKDAAKVGKEILAAIDSAGYFSDSNEVIISSVNTEEKETKAEKKLKATINEISKKAKQDSHQVKVIKATEKDLKQAWKHGQTTGIYKNNAEKEAEPASQGETKLKQPAPVVPAAIPGQDKKETNPGQEKKAVLEKQDDKKGLANNNNGKKNHPAKQNPGNSNKDKVKDNNKAQGKDKAKSKEDKDKGKDKGKDKDNPKGKNQDNQKGKNKSKEKKDKKSQQPNNNQHRNKSKSGD